MFVRPVIALLVATVLAAVGIGCGSSGNSGSSSSAGTGSTVETSSLTRAQFITRAEAICVHGNEKVLADLGTYMDNHAKEAGKSQAELTADAVRAAVLPKVEAEIEAIRELGAPAGDVVQIEAFLAAMQTSVDSLEKRPAISSLSAQLSPEFRQEGKLAREYGLTDCAYG